VFWGVLRHQSHRVSTSDAHYVFGAAAHTGTGWDRPCSRSVPVWNRHHWSYGLFERGASQLRRTRSAAVAQERFPPTSDIDDGEFARHHRVDQRRASASVGVAFEQLIFDGLRRIVREELQVLLATRPGHDTSSAAGPADYLSIAQAAEVAGLHHGTLREWIKDGTLRAYRAGRVYRILRADLDARLTAKAAEPTSADVAERVASILAKRRLRAV
jgi:excisionase family DNA binding protein